VIGGQSADAPLEKQTIIRNQPTMARHDVVAPRDQSPLETNNNSEIGAAARHDGFSRFDVTPTKRFRWRERASIFRLWGAPVQLPAL